MNFVVYFILPMFLVTMSTLMPCILPQLPLLPEFSSVILVHTYLRCSPEVPSMYIYVIIFTSRNNKISQKKRTMNSLTSAATQGQGQVTLAGSFLIHKVHLSTIFPKRNATFHGVFLLRLSVG